MKKMTEETVQAGQDIAFKAVHVCPQRGFTMEGASPKTCPVCGAPREKLARI
jgi:rubrerythrin